MGFLDELIGEINPYVRDIVPGFGLLQDLAGGAAQSLGIVSPGDVYPGMIGYGTGATAPLALQAERGPMPNYPLVPAGMIGRGLVPFTGQYIPGYRVVLRPASRGSPARAAGYYLAKPRRMNPLNPRALMRAERRMGAFSSWVHRHFRIQKSMPRRKKVGGRKRR